MVVGCVRGLCKKNNLVIFLRGEFYLVVLFYYCAAAVLQLNETPVERWGGDGGDDADVADEPAPVPARVR